MTTSNFLSTLFLLTLTASASLAQNIVFEDPNFKKALVENINRVDLDYDGEISFEEALERTYLAVIEADIESLKGIEHFTNLTQLNCSDNQIQTLDLSANINLVHLSINENLIEDIDLSPLVNLETFGCGKNKIGKLDFSNNPSLTNIYLRDNLIETLDLSNLASLEYLNFTSNQLTKIDLSNNPNLIELECQGNRLEALDLRTNTNLKEILVGSNQLTSLQLPTDSPLVSVSVSDNLLTELTIPPGSTMYRLFCDKNNLTSLDISSFESLQFLHAHVNNLQDLDVSTHQNLKELYIYDNKLSNLDVSNNPNLGVIYGSDNELTSLDVSNQRMGLLDCRNNQLTALNMKNGSEMTETYSNSNNRRFFIEGNNNLQSICADQEEITYILQALKEVNIDQVFVSDYCSFDPGGTLYTISGNVRYDLDMNGCSASDTLYNNILFEVNTNTNVGLIPLASDGNYEISLNEGSYIIEPLIDYPERFTITPAMSSVTFPDDGDALVQDYCISPIEAFEEIELELIPVDFASPGFLSNYKLVVENKGTDIAEGTIELSYIDSVMTFQFARPELTNSDTGTLFWNLERLLPFEKREYDFSMLLNTPMDVNPLSGDEILEFKVKVFTESATLPLNYFCLNQRVVNAFDPNDKTCLQGSELSPALIGDYVDYMIRFENIGTAAARNVVISDEIDITKFDLASLEVIHSSHDMNFRSRAGNMVEFYFDDINLPFELGENQGYVTYKIKTRDNLELGDTISNQALIYFDFNFPIETNVASSIFVDSYNDLDGDGYTSDIDCDDLDPIINPGQSEIAYNGIDDDCNPTTRDDDLDQDGFLIADDCDDNNAAINPDQTEEPYNGIDDDCDPATLDDDLDQDGFLVVDDCNDEDEDINPDAVEIPNNGIDEDCDDMDLLSSLHDFENILVNIYPNPASEVINIEIDGQLNFTANLYDPRGKLMISSSNTNQLQIHSVSEGMYVLEIEDLKSGNKIAERIIIGR